MTEYCFYFLNRDGGLASLQFHQCADNLDALRTAQALCNRHDAEVWEGEGLIARLKANDVRDTGGSAPRLPRLYG